MKTQNKVVAAEHMLQDVDLKKIVKEAIENEVGDSSVLPEAYVATPKVYQQVSEFVSQKTKNAHTDLYRDTVETLNDISAKIDTAEKTSNSRHSNYRSLKLDETFNLNSVWLHELYFANCFDPHSEVYMDSKSFIRLQESFGDFETWQKDFIACAVSCGNGWAICGYNIFLRKYVNTFVSNHSQDVMLGLYPLIVLDVHEHAYYKDYLTDKKSYIVASMRQINWNVVEDRFNRAEKIAGAVK